MEKYIHDEQNGLHYELIGDYYYPCLTISELPRVGIWGQRRHRYLREHQKVLYAGMLLADKLNAHLEEVDRSANEMFGRLVEQLKLRDSITEKMKAADQLEWVRRMNSILAIAEEIVREELIYI